MWASAVASAVAGTAMSGTERMSATDWASILADRDFWDGVMDSSCLRLEGWRP